MPRVQIPTRIASAPRFGARGVQARARSTSGLDNPVWRKLNRAYGDEFEHTSMASLQKLWKLRSTVAADFDFSWAGGSSLLWSAATTSAWLYRAAPPGDFQAILEFNSLSKYHGNGMCPTLALLDANGTGAGGSFYNDATTRGWGITTWAYSSTATGDLTKGTDADIGPGRTLLVSMRRSGTTLPVKFSADGGITWSTETSAGTVSSSNNLLCIGRPWSGSTPGWVALHRLNVYATQII